VTFRSVYRVSVGCRSGGTITYMNTRYSKSPRGGFTLIEILVVVSIIGILAAILIANFSDARENAKNKAIRTALSEVQLALEVYKAQNNQYPLAAPACDYLSNSNTTNSAESTSCGSVPYIEGLAPGFIHGLPAHADYGNSNCKFVYSVDSASRSYYKLTAENCFAGATSQANGVSQNDEFARCPTTCGGTGNCNPAALNFYESMAVYSYGGECK
jgi:prepilin-type N-terminal cleavage/methylation domain-containing protein